MIPTLNCSISAKDARRFHVSVGSPEVDPNTGYSAHLPLPSTRALLTEISNIVHPSPTTTSASSTSDDFFSLSSRSHPAIHAGRPSYHDTCPWTQHRSMHDAKFITPTTPSPDYNCVGSSDCLPVDWARHSSAEIKLGTQDLHHSKQSADAKPRNLGFLDTRSWGISAVRGNVPSSCEDLAEGRRRVGEILVRCGVIDVSGSWISPMESAAVGCCDTCNPQFVGVTSHLTAGLPSGDNYEISITALADWTSDWVHTLVIQPYLRGSFRFHYQGKPSSASTLLATRIRRVLRDVSNPVQVAIHALWFISTLAENSPHDNAPFLSVPIFRYLHNNGTFFAEDFMFRAFVTCAMIGDKAVNDATLSMGIWNRMTRIPKATLSATEKYVLRCLEWDIVMTRTQWQDTITHLRSCIKMGSVFDPFAYDEGSSTNIMASCLDKLIELSYADESSRQAEPDAAQPIWHLPHWILNTTEWCPTNDSVNHGSDSLDVGAELFDPFLWTQ